MSTHTKFFVKNAAVSSTPSDCIVVFYFEKAKLSDEARELDVASNGALKKTLRLEHATGKVDEAFLLRSLPGIKAERVLLLGAGEPKQLDARSLKKLIATLSKQLR